MSAAQGGVSIARNRNGDRFYSPPPVRKHRQQMLLQKQRSELDRENGRRSFSVDSENTTTLSRADSGCDVSIHSTDTGTNLDRFLQNTTPVVPALCSSKNGVKGRRKHVEADSQPYFILDDLWESFREWSAYGAGVPIVLNESESVVQYYVPFLSAIQLFVNPSRHSSVLRRASEDSDVGSSRETSSEGSCDQDVTEADIQSFNRLSLKNKTSAYASSLEGDSQSNPSAVVYEYFERDSPFIREPLAIKISILASKFPGLKTYRSCDLLPQSWLSVAWYPIYRIPTGPTLQNVDACFLTYHSLSTSKDVATPHVSSVAALHHLSNSLKLSLPTFALASYRFKASVWENDCQKEQLLLQEASNWLKLRQIEHPDYGFFITNYINPLIRR